MIMYRIYNYIIIKGFMIWWQSQVPKTYYTAFFCTVYNAVVIEME